MRKLIPYFLLLLIIVVGIVGYTYRNRSQGESANRQQSITADLEDGLALLKSQAFPFSELTITSLREREYKSELGERKELSRNSAYTSYLTSYQSDGLKINGMLTIPNSTKPDGGYPAIVFVHGYIAPSAYRTTERYVDYVGYLASRGFVVFKIDLRGHGESEGTPGGAYYSSDYVVDTLNAYSALENADFVDPEAIGLWGHSMAGNVTFRSFVVRQDIPAIAIWAGAGYSYADLVKYGLSDNSYRPPTQNTERQRQRERLRELYGTFDPQIDFWRNIAPTNFLENIEGAVALHHAVDDPVVNVGYSRDLAAILTDKGLPHELYEYPSGGHDIEGASFSLAMQRTVDFYKMYLK